MTTAIICGGNNFDDFTHMYRVLKPLGITHVKASYARGASRLAVQWAKLTDIGHTLYHAQWEEHPRQAAALRNRDMLVMHNHVDLIVTFGTSRDVNNLVNMARRFDPAPKIIIVPLPAIIPGLDRVTIRMKGI